MSDDIKLDSVEERREKDAQDCLPRGVRAMVVGSRVIFVKRMGGHWVPVPEHLQQKLAEKHIIEE